MARLADNPAKPLVAPSAQEKFGARGELARIVEKKDPVSEVRLEQLDAMVTAIVRRPHGQLVVTLDNSQVWQQLTIGENFRLKIADKVTLKRGVLGSYFLVGPYGRAMKVKRIQ